MVTKPRTASGPDALNVVDGRGAAPEVGVVVHAPAASAILIASRARAADCEVIDHREQRVSAFGQIAQFSGPIIHFAIDIQRPLALPRRIEFFVPKALQVGGLAAGTAA